MKKTNPILNFIFSLDVFVGSVMLAILITVTVLGVAFRYFLNQPFTWLEEIQLACMVWMTFAASGAAFRYGNHVAIEIVVDLFPEKLQKIVDIFISAVVVIVLGYFFYKSIGYIQSLVKSGRATPMFSIPYALIYGIAPVMCIDMIISFFYAKITGVKSEAKEAIGDD